jgi:AsmA protein
MRKALKIFAAILVVLVLVLLAAPFFLNVNRYHDRIQSELQQKLGRQVSLGTMHLKLIPFAFRVDNAVIGEDPNFGKGSNFAQANELYVTAALMPLLHGDVQIKSLELRQPKIELIKNAEGKWNFSSLGSPSQQPNQAQQQAPSQPQAPNKPSAANPQPEKQRPISLEDLKITDGQVALTDNQKHEKRAVYDHIDLRLVGYSPDKPFDFELAAHLPGQGAQLIKLSGKAGPIDSQDSINTPFKGSIDLDHVSLDALQRFLNSSALENSDAVASGKADLTNDNGKASGSGSLKLEQARFNGHDLGYPISADFDLSADMNSKLLEVRKGNIKLGSTPLDITGRVNAQPTPAKLDVQLKANNVSIQEAARLAASLGVAFNPSATIAGQLSADIRAQGSSKSPAMNGSISGRDLTITGAQLKSPVKVNSIELALAPDSIRSNNFTASTGRTNVAVQFALAKYTSPSPSIDATVRTLNGELGELLTIAKAYGVNAVEGMNGSGAVALDLHAVGPVKGAGAMNLSGSGKLQNATIESDNLTKPLQVRNADLRFTQDSAVFENLNAGIGSTNASGNLTAKNFTAPQVQFTLNADKINVVELKSLFKDQPQQQQQKSAQMDWSLVPSAYAQKPAAAQPSLIARTSGTGTISVGTIINDKLVLNNVHSNVNIDHGVIKLAPITAQAYGGTTNGTITVDARNTPMRYAVDTTLNNVDANKLLSSVSSLKSLYGIMATNAKLNFASDADSSDIARSLNGNVALGLNNGKIMGMDIPYELAAAGQFLSPGQVKRDFTNINKVTGDMNIQNGVAQTNNFKAFIDDGTIAATGAANLADQSLNMHVTAVLNKEFSQRVGGTNIGGYLQTALANKNGELVIPVIVTGTFQNPHFAPDLQKIAQMKLDNLVPTLGNPGALGSILGGVLGNNKQQGTNGQPAQKQDKVGQILGALGGKQPQQQQQTQGQQQPQQQGEPAPQQGQQPSSTTQQQQNKQPSWGDILQGALGGQKKQQPTSTQQPAQQPAPEQQKPKDYSEQPPQQPK